MSRDASITFEWAGEHRTFRLPIGQLRSLQEAINKPRAAIGAPLIGPADLMAALATGNAWPDEVAAIILRGLIGGGLKPAEAHPLVRDYVETRPLAESLPAAQLILGAAIFGSDEEALPEGKAEAASPETTGSSSPPITESEPS